jgi:hypothetical protein
MKIQAWPMRYVLSGGLAVLFLIIIVGAAAHRRITFLPIRAQLPPSVINNTQAIRVISTNVTANRTVEVALLNDSSNFIDFYTFSIRGQRIMPLAGIAPGDTTIQKFPLAQFEDNGRTNASSPSELVILALSFREGGGEGDPEEMNILQETTLGMRDEIKLVLPLLRNAANSPLVESEHNLSSLIDQSSQLSSKTEKNGVSASRKGGRELAELLIGMQLKSLRDAKAVSPSKSLRRGIVEQVGSLQKRYPTL